MWHLGICLAVIIVVLGWQLDSILKASSNLDDSVILSL